jgi:hypothetical protein
VADGFATGAAVRRPRRQLKQFSPIFPVADLAVGLAHYAKLGFKTFAYADGADYGFADREGLSLHLAHRPDHDPAYSGCSAYMYVRGRELDPLWLTRGGVTLRYTLRYSGTHEPSS